jgi:hypothetical protein
MKSSYELPIFFESIYEEHLNSTLYSRPYPFWDVRECPVSKLRDLQKRMKAFDDFDTHNKAYFIWTIIVIVLTFIVNVGVIVLKTGYESNFMLRYPCCFLILCHVPLIVLGSVTVNSITDSISSSFINSI